MFLSLGITGILTLSIFLYYKEHNVSEIRLFPSSGEGWETYFAGSVRKS
jgi:hypothetical protein